MWIVYQPTTETIHMKDQALFGLIVSNQIDEFISILKNQVKMDKFILHIHGVQH